MAIRLLQIFALPLKQEADFLIRTGRVRKSVVTERPGTATCDVIKPLTFWCVTYWLNHG
jgi:hypothetical protein